MSALPIAAVEAVASSIQLDPSARLPATPPVVGFGAHLIDGLEQVNDTLLQAEAAAGRFALDDSVPPHQVTFALEHARMSLELMLQVRSRLIEGYQELLRMPL